MTKGSLGKGSQVQAWRVPTLGVIRGIQIGGECFGERPLGPVFVFSLRSAYFWLGLDKLSWPWVPPAFLLPAHPPTNSVSPLGPLCSSGEVNRTAAGVLENLGEEVQL